MTTRIARMNTVDKSFTADTINPINSKMRTKGEHEMPKLSQAMPFFDRCVTCRAPLRINNTTGYCQRHASEKVRYANEPGYRERILAANARWHEAHKAELAAKAKARYEARKAAKRAAPDPSPRPSLGVGVCDGCEANDVEVFAVDGAPLAGGALCSKCLASPRPVAAEQRTGKEG